MDHLDVWFLLPNGGMPGSSVQLRTSRTSYWICYLFIYLFIWLYHVFIGCFSCGSELLAIARHILVPGPEIEPWPLALGGWSLSH